MTEQPLHSVVRRIHQLASGPEGTGPSDPELLHRFCEHRDETAFAMLLRRHGPMVREVCRRLLGQDSDADDAFQAVFLVLIRKATSIRKQTSLASWLHGVTCHIARQVRRAATRRRNREQRQAPRPVSEPDQETAWRELCGVLDVALHGLSERYRAPLVLCYLEGRTRDEAARQLQLSLRTLDRRLERGRELLRGRLARRGLTLSAVLLATGLSQPPGHAALAAALEVAVLSLARGAAGAGEASARVAALAEAGLRSLAFARLQGMAILVMALGVIAAGADFLAHQVRTPHSPRRPQANASPAAPQEAKPSAKTEGRTDNFGDSLPAGARTRLGTTRFRIPVAQSLVYTPDGRFLVAGTQRGTLVLDAATGKEVRRLGIELDNSRGAMALSPDGRLLAVGCSRDSGGIVYETRTGRMVCRFGEHARAGKATWPAYPTCFSPDGKILAVDTTCNAIELYDSATGTLLRSLAWHFDKASENFTEDVAFMPDGKTLIATAHQEGVIRFWDVAAGKVLHTIRASSHGVAHMALSPDGRLLAWVNRLRAEGRPAGAPPNENSFPDNRVHIWDTALGKEIREFVVPDNSASHSRRGPHSLAFTRDSKSLLSVGFEPVVRVWDPLTGKERRRFADWQGSYPWALAFHPDGKSFAVAEHATAVRVRDLTSGRDRISTEGHRADVWKTAVSPDGRMVATAGLDGLVWLWDPASGRPLRRLGGLPGDVSFLSFTADSRGLLLGAADQTIQDVVNTEGAWDTATGRLLWRLEKHDTDAAPQALSPDGTLLAVASTTVTALIDPRTGQTRRRLPGAGEHLAAVTFSEDGHTIRGSAAAGHSLHSWDLATGEHTQRPCEGLSKRPFVTAFSPDDRLVALGGWAPDLVLADATTGRVIRHLPAVSDTHAGMVFCMAFSPDGRTLAWSGPADRLIRLVEVATGGQRHLFAGHSGRVTALAFSADGQTLVSAADDTTALVWDLSGRLDEGALSTLSPQALACCWKDLASSDIARAYKAMQRLRSAPAQSIPFLTAKVRARLPLDEREVSRRLSDLDSDSFAARQTASAELEQLGERAEPLLRKALSRHPPAETRRRIEALLGKLEGSGGDRMRMLRVVEILESIATPDARDVLQALAQDASVTCSGKEAQASLERLARRDR